MVSDASLSCQQPDHMSYNLLVTGYIIILATCFGL